MMEEKFKLLNWNKTAKSWKILVSIKNLKIARSVNHPIKMEIHLRFYSLLEILEPLKNNLKSLINNINRKYQSWIKFKKFYSKKI